MIEAYKTHLKMQRKQHHLETKVSMESLTQNSVRMSYETQKLNKNESQYLEDQPEAYVDPCLVLSDILKK